MTVVLVIPTGRVSFLRHSRVRVRSNSSISNSIVFVTNVTRFFGSSHQNLFYEIGFQYRVTSSEEHADRTEGLSAKCSTVRFCQNIARASSLTASVSRTIGDLSDPGRSMFGSTSQVSPKHQETRTREGAANSLPCVRPVRTVPFVLRVYREVPETHAQT